MRLRDRGVSERWRMGRPLLGAAAVAAFLAASAKGRSDLVLLLIEKGADVNARTDDKRTALTIAESGGLSAIAGMLIRAGARK